MLFGYGGGREPSVGAENECLPSPRVCAASARGEGKGEGPASREEPLPLRFAPATGRAPAPHPYPLPVADDGARANDPLGSPFNALPHFLVCPRIRLLP